MKVFIQRTTDQLFLKAGEIWVTTKEEATAFPNCTPAIDFCVERGLRGVRLWLSFEDASYDFPMEVFRPQTEALGRLNQELREQSRALMSELDVARAEAKERKKKVPFKRKEMGDGKVSRDGEAA